MLRTEPKSSEQFGQKKSAIDMEESERICVHTSMAGLKYSGHKAQTQKAIKVRCRITQLDSSPGELQRMALVLFIRMREYALHNRAFQLIGIALCARRKAQK